MSLARDAIALVSLGMVVFGMFSFSKPAGYVCGGALLFGITIAWSWFSVNRRSD